jgi:multisubunit Na+/H+ antiporter MnhC subunit
MGDRDNKISFMQKLYRWFKKNFFYFRGGAAFFIGIYLVVNTISLVFNIVLFSLGVLLALYGLSEFNFFSISQLFSKCSDFFNRNLKS